MQTVTAVLITTKDEYPKDILEIIQAQPQINEVLIETRSTSVWNRFKLAQRAVNDVIYTQDDDCYVDNIQELLKRFESNCPRKIVHNCQEHHFNFYKEKCSNQIALIGWGSVFGKQHLQVFDLYFRKCPLDRLFELTADRVFTYLNAPHDVIIRPTRDHENAKGLRMSTRPDHWIELENILARLKLL